MPGVWEGGSLILVLIFLVRKAQEYYKNLFAQQSENTKWPLRVSNNWSQTQTKYFDLQWCSLFYYDELFLHDSIKINIYGRHEAQKAYNIVVLSFVLIYVFVLKFPLLS